jgi:hypothetical protein
VVVPEPFVQRRRRPVALITLAAVLIVAAGAVYLRPAATVGPHTTPVTAIDPSFASKNPVDYAFVTPSIGWAAMALGGLSSTAVEFRIFRTIDGAKHWQQQLAGQSNHGLGFLPISVQFFGKTRGFMTVGQPIEQIYRTDDGGERWDPLAIPLPRVDAITFSNATSGWLVSYTGAGIPTQIAPSETRPTPGWAQSILACRTSTRPATAVTVGSGMPCRPLSERLQTIVTQPESNCFPVPARWRRSRHSGAAEEVRFRARP